MAVFSNTTAYGLVTSGSGFFEIPISDFSGKCNDNNFLKFEKDFKKSSCIRQLTFPSNKTFDYQCTSGYSVQKYVNNLYVARCVIFFILYSNFLLSHVLFTSAFYCTSPRIASYTTLLIYHFLLNSPCLPLLCPFPLFFFPFHLITMSTFHVLPLHLVLISNCQFCLFLFFTILLLSFIF